MSIDGIGAFDHVFRSAMPAKLHEEPRLRALYSERSCYWWRDSEGVQHPIWQCEGGEQGDPLMPLLLSLAIHDSLRDVKQGMQQDEELFAFLDKR